MNQQTESDLSRIAGALEGMNSSSSYSPGIGLEIREVWHSIDEQSKILSEIRRSLDYIQEVLEERL